jgi:hypothetical protein
LATWAQHSEDTNFVAVHIQQIIVNGEQANEGEEIEDGLHSLSTFWAEILATWTQRSEDTVHVQQIVVNGEEANKDKKIEDGLHSLSTS